jgi:hypothetical protein
MTEEERAPAVRDLRIGQSVSQSSDVADSERVDESRFDGEGEGGDKKSKWKARSSTRHG